MKNLSMNIQGWSVGVALGVFLIAGVMFQGIPSANAQQEKIASNPKIQCKMAVKEGKNKKAIVSWQCANTAGWTCSLTGTASGLKKETKPNVTLPNGSLEMAMEEGHSENRTIYTGYRCSSYYSSGLYHTSRGYCGNSSMTVPSYSSASNDYAMKCVSTDGRIKRFSKMYFK